jgi:hypothetical protein
MIIPKEAKAVTKLNKRIRRNLALKYIDSHPSIGWDRLRDQIEASIYYSIVLSETAILASFSDNENWNKNTIHNTLMNLGFKVDFSCSSSPVNERWTIKWK